MLLLEGEPPITPEIVGGILGGGLALIVAAVLWARKIWGTVMPLLHRADDQLQQVLHEQRPNHGGSLRDSIDRIEGLVTQHAAALASLRETVADIQADGKRHDRELARANDLLAQATDRANQSERHTGDQLSDHSQRIHHLETLATRYEIPTAARRGGTTHHEGDHR